VVAGQLTSYPILPHRPCEMRAPRRRRGGIVDSEILSTSRSPYPILPAFLPAHRQALEQAAGTHLHNFAGESVFFVDLDGHLSPQAGGSPSCDQDLEAEVTALSRRCLSISHRSRRWSTPANMTPHFADRQLGENRISAGAGLLERPCTGSGVVRDCRAARTRRRQR